MYNRLAATLGAMMLCALFTAHTAFAQIIVTNATFPGAGDTLKMAVDNSPSVFNLIFTAPGGPQTWDLSSLQVQGTQNYIFRAASEGSVSGQVSGAELVTIPPSPHAEEYYNVTANRFELQAYYGIAPYDLVSNALFRYSPPLEERQAPLNFFDTYSSSSGVLEKFLPSAFTPSLLAALNAITAPAQPDSLRYRVATSQIDVVDAYGSMTVPGGTYEVLREKRTRYTETRLDGKYPPLGWLDITNDAIQAGFHGLGVDTTVSFFFYNDVAKEPIAKVTLNAPQSAAAQTLFKYNAPTSSTPSLSINNVTQNEGNAGTTSFDFTVSLTQPAPAGGVTFDLATANGTTNPATAPSDYTTKSLIGQTIPAASSTYSFSVLVNGDTDVEPDETFFVNVTNVTGAYLSDGQGLGTITNEDVAPNTAPVNTVPGPQTTNQNTALVFSSGNGNAISISDADAGAAQVQVKLTATNGTLILASTIGLSFSIGDGTADATMTFTGTISNINAALNGLSYTPTLGFNGAASLLIVTNDLGNTGSGGPLSDDDTVNITVAAPVKPFVFVANKVTLKSTKQSTPGGNIHSNGTLVVEKGKPSTYNSNLTAVGKITIGKYNTINGNVKSQTSVSNSGTINGTKSVGSVNTEALPSLSYSAGGANQTVPSGGSLTLAPGSYDIVTLNNNGTLKLTSGEYFMNELRYSSTIDYGTIEIDLSSGAKVTINVVSNLQFGHDAAIRLLPNGESDSKLVTFNTMQSTAANWGREAYLLGSFNAPNAVVTLVKNSQLRGTICAKEILVSNDCLFLHHDSPGSLPGPGNLPKSSFDEEETASDQSPVTSYQLEQNYPNPFNPTTVISFQLPASSEVTLSIFNTNGQLVKKLVAGAMNAGTHSFTWDATNERGEAVASGVYLYVIKAGEFTAQRKLVLMK